MESAEFLEPSHEVFAKLKVRMSQLKLSKPDSSTLETSSISSSSAKAHCRLPKLEIPSFSGNPLDWQGFLGPIQRVGGFE